MKKNKFLASLVTTGLIGMMVAPSIAFADAPIIFSDSFGTGSSVSDIPEWEEEGSDSDSSTLAKSGDSSGEDKTSPDGGRFAKIAEDEYICKIIDNRGNESASLSYYWRGDSDAGSSDHGIVEVRKGESCTASSGWTSVSSEDLSNDSSWTGPVSKSLSSSVTKDSKFALKFRNASSYWNEYFRVDGVSLSATLIVVDTDSDGFADTNDNCPTVSNPTQTNTDTDTQGDACDTDDDNDGVSDNTPDNCPLATNADQADADGDGIGNVCDETPYPPDQDDDGIADDTDNCPTTYNPEQTDADGDRVGDSCDNCPSVSNADQADTNENRIGDVCEVPDAENTLALCTDGMDNDEDDYFDLADESCAQFKPSLTVVKHVEGGELPASAFTLLLGYNLESNMLATESWGQKVASLFVETAHAMNPFYHNTNITGAEAPGETVVFDEEVFNYAVTENDTENYSKSFSEDCNGSLDIGEHKTCTVTNTYLIEETPCEEKIIPLTLVSDTSNHVGTADGPVATALTFIHDAWTATVSGAASWIWSVEPLTDPVNDTTETFYYTFSINNPVAGDATLSIAADNSYDAWINGTLVGTSADENNFAASTQDVHTVSGAILHTGTNELKISVKNLAQAEGTPTLNPAGLLYKLDYTTNSCQLPEDGEEEEIIPVYTPVNNGGGAGTPPVLLPISFMNKVIATQSNGDVIVSWETNYPAFGHVVYGMATDTPYVYDKTKPHFGYTNSVPTDPSVVGHDDPLGRLLNHTYTLTGLTKGATYKIRIVSHGSPVTVDEEATITIPADVQPAVTEPITPATEGDEQPIITFAAPTEDTSGNASILTGGATAGSETLGAEEPEVIAPADTATATDETNADANLAAAGASSGMNIWWWLLILIAAATGGYYLQKKNKDGKK